MTCVSMGNPHAVVFVTDTKHLAIEEVGPCFEHHKRFPKRTNTEFVQFISRNEINMRVWERGAGETWACGTGTCASVMACILNGYTDYSSIGIKNGRSRCPARNGMLLVKLYFDLTYSILEI